MVCICFLRCKWPFISIKTSEGSISWMSSQKVHPKQDDEAFKRKGWEGGLGRGGKEDSGVAFVTVLLSKEIT